MRPGGVASARMGVPGSAVIKMTCWLSSGTVCIAQLMRIRPTTSARRKPRDAGSRPYGQADVTKPQLRSVPQENGQTAFGHPELPADPAFGSRTVSSADRPAVPRYARCQRRQPRVAVLPRAAARQS